MLGKEEEQEEGFVCRPLADQHCIVSDLNGSGTQRLTQSFGLFVHGRLDRELETVNRSALQHLHAWPGVQIHKTSTPITSRVRAWCNQPSGFV